MADLAVAKSGPTTVDALGSITYTIVVTNNGPGVVLGAAVTDNFPAALTCTWFCTGAGFLSGVVCGQLEPCRRQLEADVLVLAALLGS